MGTTSVDPAALRAAAQRVDSAADMLIGAVHRHLGALQFDGRAELRTPLDRLREDMLQWSRAARELAAALAVGARQHAAADTHAASVIR